VANYNYGYGNTGNFSGFSVNPWIQAMTRPDRFMDFENGMYNSDPNLALDTFLRSIRTSNTNEDMIRRMLPSIKNQWVQQQMVDARNGLGTLRPFSDFLGTYNWDRELARYAPDVRRESPSMFTRPVRTVTF
jgi:hypothetical protein